MDKQISNCRSCNAEIIWIKTPAGRNHPINAKPKKMWVWATLANEWQLVDCYETHYFTCPDADKWRKKK